MSVFVGRRLLGVAQRVPRKFGAERLHARPCRKLLADRQFRKALGLDDRQAQLAEVRRKLAKRLSPTSVAALAQALGAEEKLTGLNSASQAEALATFVPETDIRLAVAAASPPLSRSWRWSITCTHAPCGGPSIGTRRVIAPLSSGGPCPS
jgi:hypothetical protein